MSIDISWLKNLPIAHRGLHSIDESIPENSMKAFSNAANKGFAIELDVYVNRKNDVVVFHDESLQRICKYDKSIFAYDVDLHRDYYKILDTDQSIPTLLDVFKEVNNRVPIIIHIRESRFKKNGKYGITKRKISYTEIYKAMYLTLNTFKNQTIAIQSFDPFLLGVFAKKFPNVIRGQMSSHFENEKINRLTKHLLSNYKLNWCSKPHYLAHNYLDTKLPIKFLQKQRKKGVPTLCWTITTPEDHKKALENFDNIIFENFTPSKTLSKQK